METRPLTPALGDDYERLFARAFSDNPAWGGCWCALFDDPCADADWDATEPGFGARNRARRLEAIAAGQADGLLAYIEGQPVGWLNAARRDRVGNLRKFASAVDPGDPVVGSILCFVVDPDHRGRGVATGLLEAADGHLRSLGAEVAEAYPRTTPAPPELAWTAAFYKGSVSMFDRAGYRPYGTGDGFAVVRKTLT